ncbi:FimB/Mfa2 family fimbrial subunit [uncultured Duncaniella sp.]|uniref:FimB/Mfa2 family fimbrial subunit n=1 Tax=uncultured Duncaniella sp. TaxID=2768039 RepID=UPI002729EB80|nr:FimB/Mfa2 family fimbrial subunit [uncultured Duncaniella sp.]
MQAVCAAAAMLSATIALSSCDSVIYDDEGDCSVRYRVGFRYTKNILNADAFGSQVTGVSLYLFDKAGNLVLHKTAERAVSTENDFYMDVDVRPGTYDILAWCEGKSVIPDATSFVIGNGAAPSSIDEVSASLPLQGTAPDLYSDRDITRLYHGLSSGVVFPDTYGTVDIAPVMLTKDTNHLSVLLQNVDGKPLGKDMFKFEIEASNSQMDYRNTIVGNTPFTYMPWSVENTSASFDDSPSTGRDGTVGSTDMPNGVLAELTTGRLMAGREQYLRISNAATGDVVIRIPLIRYLLLVRNKYEQADSDQDYLDRYDDFTLMFFIGEGMTWSKTKIYINSWRVVPPQDEEL